MTSGEAWRQGRLRRVAERVYSCRTASAKPAAGGRDEENVSFLYVTHDLSTSQYVGDNIIILYKGQIIEQGNIHEVLLHPLHPYTKALISAIPKFNNVEKINIKNDVETCRSGCKFLNRCLYSSEECMNTEPTLIEANSSHSIRCYNYKSI